MTELLLPLGSALVAFGPFVSMFSLIAYQKAQLVIVVTSAAFFFLLASVGAGAFWVVLDRIGLSSPFAAIIPGVFFQFIARCNFVATYHVVERVIQTSLEKQHEQEQRQRLTNNTTAGTNPGTDQTVAALPAQQGEGNKTQDEWSEAAKLRLALNDASCGVAAGIGFGGMHAILLFGTLLASQLTNNVGVLYQESCPSMPSLVVSAIFACCFTILDIFWMLFTFFGMRRRLLYHRGDREPNEAVSIGGWLGNSRTGGNMALLIVLGTHLVTALATASDAFKYGCTVSLSVVGGMVLFTAYLFWAGVGRIYMPPKRRQSPIVNHIYRSMNPGRDDPQQHVTDFERHED